MPPWINFFRRQMATLTGFALGHLDLDLVRTDEITAGHAETAGSHLFDGEQRVARFPWNPDGHRSRRPHRCLIFHGACSWPGPAFHGFLGNGTLGHGAGLEMTDDAVHALHFLDGDRLGRIIEVQKASQVSAGLLIHHAVYSLKIL